MTARKMNGELENKRVLVTRPAHQAEKLAAPLRALGAEVILLPMLEVLPPANLEPLRHAIENLASYRWIVFTSANAVRAIGELLAAQSKSFENFPGLQIAAVGEETAHALEAFGAAADLLPDEFTAASLAATLAPDVAGQRVLLPQQPGANSSLSNALTAAGAMIDRVDAYQTALPADAAASLKAAFSDSDRSPNVLTFTSAQTARNFFSLVSQHSISLPSGTVIASIGPSTTAALTALGFPPQVAATLSTAQALADALAVYFAAI
jgi:uroporphyrinogen-III synthase